jgi:hypothetical protein
MEGISGSSAADGSVPVNGVRPRTNPSRGEGAGNGMMGLSRAAAAGTKRIPGAVPRG